MKTIARSNKYILALVLAVALVLTAIFGLLAVSHSKAASPASLEEKKAGWYAVRSGAVDLACNGVLQNKFGSWFVEDGKVNFGYTGWLVCEGTYYYVTSGKADKPASLPTFAIPKTKSSTAGTNSATTAKAGTNSVNGTNQKTLIPVLLLMKRTAPTLPATQRRRPASKPQRLRPLQKLRLPQRKLRRRKRPIRNLQRRSPQLRLPRSLRRSPQLPKFPSQWMKTNFPSSQTNSQAAELGHV